MYKTASCILTGNLTSADEVKIIQNFDLCSLGDGDLAHLAGKLAYGQFRPTDPTNTWTKWVRDYGVAKWVKDYKLDLVMLDCIFDFGDPFVAVRGVALDLVNGPLHTPVMPNFADYWTWTGTSGDKAKNEWALTLGAASEWHLVQMAYDIRTHSQNSWNSLRHAAELRLLSGKKLVLGIYDPGRQHEMLAALLMASFQHENLYWHYNAQKDSVNVDDNLNSYWGLAR